MKIEKELRKKTIVIIKPSVKAAASKLAFNKNLSFSRLVENLLINELNRSKTQA